jgi:hypothetical protein
MSNLPSARTAAIFLSLALMITSQTPASSQDLPPAPVAPQDAPAANTEAPQQTGTTAVDAPEIAPGPLSEQRKKLYETIMTAKGYGFGITAYMSAFNALEDSVKAGASEKDIQTRLNSIVSGLTEQLKRSQQLKIQKPAPPIAESSPPPSSMQIPSSVRNALQGGNADNLIEKVKEKWFGGEIPDSIKKKIPANFDPSMLNSDQARELMKRYQGGR